MGLYQYKATITEIYDADTITADVDLGFGVLVKDLRFRLYGIDAPEIRGDERERGLRARDALRNKLNGPDVTLHTFKRATSALDLKGSFGRWLAIVYQDGRNLNQWLVHSGFAKEYRDGN